MRYIAFHDTLTKLPNREAFQNELERLLTLAERHNECLALLFLDVDNFKSVNDTLGHDAGDVLLAGVATRLKGALRNEDFISRIGGDEFSILLYGIKQDHFAGVVAEKILKSLEEPFMINAHSVVVTVSIGIACYPTVSANSATLMKAADMAMYRAKDKGRNCFAF